MGGMGRMDRMNMDRMNMDRMNMDPMGMDRMDRMGPGPNGSMVNIPSSLMNNPNVPNEIIHGLQAGRIGNTIFVANVRLPFYMRQSSFYILFVYLYCMTYTIYDV